jgi:hypothetical protein
MAFHNLGRPLLSHSLLHFLHLFLVLFVFLNNLFAFLVVVFLETALPLLAALLHAVQIVTLKLFKFVFMTFSHFTLIGLGPSFLLNYGFLPEVVCLDVVTISFVLEHVLVEGC